VVALGRSFFFGFASFGFVVAVAESDGEGVAEVVGGAEGLGSLDPRPSEASPSRSRSPSRSPSSSGVGSSAGGGAACAVGVALGGADADPCFHENATYPPSGIRSEPADVEEYAHRPDEPSDQ
jgi:hypothetical protein